MNPFRTADPVMDAAQGRPMIVLDAPEQTVAEWSADNGYDLMGNYGNSKFDPSPDEYVVRCAYLGSVSSEPSKDYTFPESRVVLIDAHNADDYRRMYDRVAVEVLAKLMVATQDAQIRSHDILSHVDRNDVSDLARVGFATEDMVQEARELADVEQRFAEDA